MTKNNVFGENKCDQLIKGCDVTKIIPKIWL